MADRAFDPCQLLRMMTGVYAEAPAVGWPFIFPVIAFIRHHLSQADFTSKRNGATCEAVTCTIMCVCVCMCFVYKCVCVFAFVLCVCCV